MRPETREYWDKIGEQFSDRMSTVAMAEVDRYSATRTERLTAAVEMGKALIFLGCNVLGNAVQVEADPTVAKAAEVIRWFQAQATRRRDQLLDQLGRDVQ